MLLSSMGENLTEELRQKAEAHLPLLRKEHGAHAWVEIRRYLDAEGRERVSAKLRKPESDRADPEASSEGVVVVDELADRKDLLRPARDPLDLGDVLHRANLQVVLREDYSDLLEVCPHVELLDLIGLLCVPVELAGSLTGLGLLQKTDLRNLGITPEEFCAAARENMALRSGVQVVSADAMGLQLRRDGTWKGTPLQKTRMDERGMYFVGSQEHGNSASLILVPKVLETLEEKMGGPIFLAFTVADALMVTQDRGNPRFPKRLAWVLRQRRYWPSGFVDHLYRYERSTGLQIVQEDCA